jgi:hypothetical protein
MSENRPSPPASGKKRSIRTIHSSKSYFEAPLSSEDDDNGPTEDELYETPKKKKKKKTPSAQKKAQQPRKKAGKKAILGKQQAEGLNPLMDLSHPTTKWNPQREPAIERSPATVNLNHFFDNIHRLSINKDAQFDYTPAEELTKHVLDCDVHENRNFVLVDEPTLEDTTHRNGRKTKAWRIRVSDSKDPGNILQPYCVNPLKQSWVDAAHGPQSACPMEKIQHSDGRFYAHIPESLRLSKSAVPTLKTLSILPSSSVAS